MFRKLSFLITVLALSTTMTLNAAEKDESELGSTSQPSKKIRLEEKAKPEAPKTETMPEVSIDLRPHFRKDIVVELNLSGNVHITDINFLLSFPTLTSLNLTDCQNLKDNYYPVSGLTNLRTLDMMGIGLITTTEPLKLLINLTSLKICIFEGSLKHIVQLPALKDLTLAGCDTELDQLSELKSLERLSLRGMLNNQDADPSYCTPSLDFLSKMIGLKTLDLGWNDYLFYIKPLVNLPNLTDLNLAGSRVIRDLGEISKLKSLVKLDLDYIDETYIPTIKKDLEPLKELKHLKILTVYSLTYAPTFPKERNVVIYETDKSF